MTARARLKVKCPCCGREVGTYVPAGGDGSAVRPLNHKDPEGRPCDGRFWDVDLAEAWEW